jgi:hypothetical protein
VDYILTVTWSKDVMIESLLDALAKINSNWKVVNRFRFSRGTMLRRIKF